MFTGLFSTRKRIGDSSFDIQHLIDLITLKSKIEHSLIKCDINPKGRQSFASCRRISSDLVLNLLNNNENCIGTYVYLLLLRLIITELVDKSTNGN